MTRKENKLLLAHIQQEIDYVRSMKRLSELKGDKQQVIYYSGIEHGLEFAQSSLTIAYVSGLDDSGDVSR
jgi:hypothetical protein